MTFLKNDTIWRGLAVGLLTILVGIGGWGLLEVTAMPKTYITKEDAGKQKAELSKQIDDLKNDLSSDICRIMNRINKGQERTDKSLEKLQDLVLEHMMHKKDETP